MRIEAVTNTMKLFVIYSGKHQQKSLGCYGHPFVEFPVLDELAALFAHGAGRGKS